MTRGWFNHPSEHSLASKGVSIKAKANIKTHRIDINKIKTELKSIDAILPNSVYVREYSDHIEATFKLEDKADMPSSIVYYPKENLIVGTLRLSSDKENEIRNTLSNNHRLYDTRIHTGDRRNATHIDFEFEGANPQKFDETIEKIHRWTKTLKEGDYL